MAEKRKSCRQRTLELIAETGPEKVSQFPFQIPASLPHKVGKAVYIPSSPGTLVKVRCKCPVQQWIAAASLTKKGRKPGRFCFVCGGAREVVR